MNRATRLAILAVLTACTRPSEDRAEAELLVGTAAITDVQIEIAGGLAVVRTLTDHYVELRAQAPGLDISLVLGPTTSGDWTIRVRNTMPDATLTVDGTIFTRAPDEPPTVATFTVPLATGTHTLRLAPPDIGVRAPFRVAAMADIQTSLDNVDEVFRAIDAIPGVRFVVGMGDISENAERWEYDLFEFQLRELAVPFYTTLGNHDTYSPGFAFFERLGRASFQFEFKGAMFTFADSGDAAIDPLVEQQLEGWLANGLDRTNVFLTHIPPIDPVGTRYGAFRSTRDGNRLIERLVEGRVDLTLFGHIHTFISYDNAGIPAYVSGGGGAWPVRGDGIGGRHFLVVDLDPEAGAVPSVTPSGIVSVTVQVVP
jgi:Icc protein